MERACILLQEFQDVWTILFQGMMPIAEGGPGATLPGERLLQGGFHSCGAERLLNLLPVAADRQARQPAGHLKLYHRPRDTAIGQQTMKADDSGSGIPVRKPLLSGGCPQPFDSKRQRLRSRETQLTCQDNQCADQFQLRSAVLPL